MVDTGQRGARCDNPYGRKFRTGGAASRFLSKVFCTNAARYNNGPTTEKTVNGKYSTMCLILPNCGTLKKSAAKA